MKEQYKNIIKFNFTTEGSASVQCVVSIKPEKEDYEKILERNKELEDELNHDSLTGLLNRRCYEMLRCNQQWLANTSVGVIFADLNCLKRINDSKGHNAGDAYIRRCAQKLESFFNDYECYRYGGDEFLVIATGEEQEAFEARARQFRCLLGRDKVPMAAVGWNWSNTADDIETVTLQADYMMGDDKRVFYRHHPDYVRSYGDRQM